MANRIYLPYINPIHVIDAKAAVIPQYTSRTNFKDYLFTDTILRHEQPVRFYQPWLTVDAVRLQYTSNYQPVTLKMFRCDGSLIYSNAFTQGQENADQPGFFIYQCDLDLATYPAGDYYFEVWAGTVTSGVPASLSRSEPQRLRESWGVPNLLIEYSHFEKRAGIWFQAPFFPTIRIPGNLKYEDTDSKDTIYADQDENEEMLHSTNFTLWRLFVGDAPGIPAWFKDKLSYILGCSDVKIDGRYYTKAEGAKWEKAEQKNYPMKGWTIQLREKFNRDSAIIDNDATLRGIAAAGLIVDPKGFGLNDNSNNDYLEIESLI